jgi:hypothetical protein
MQDTMNRNGGKSSTRGQKAANHAKTIVKGSQDHNSQATTSPLRNHGSRYKALQITNSRSPSTSPARQDKNPKNPQSTTKNPSFTQDGTGQISKENASTPKASSSSPYPSGLHRSASASSAQKHSNSTQKTGNLRRSMSDNTTATTTKELHTNPQSSPEIDSPEDTEDEYDKSARGGGSSAHKTPQAKGSPGRTTDTRSSHKKQKGQHLGSETRSDVTTDTRPSHKKRKSQQLDSSSNSDDDFEQASVPSPKSKKGSARKEPKQKPLDLSSSDAAIGNINLLCCSQTVDVCILFCDL